MRIPKPIKDYIKQYLTRVYSDFKHQWNETHHRLQENLSLIVLHVIRKGIGYIDDHEKFSDDHDGISIPYSFIEEQTKDIFVDATLHENGLRVPAFEAWGLSDNEKAQVCGIYHDFFLEKTVRSICRSKRNIKIGMDWYFFFALVEDFYKVGRDEYQTCKMIKLGRLGYSFEEPKGLVTWFKKKAIVRSWQKNKGKYPKPIVYEKDGKLTYRFPR
jgi:hypothetical protein